MQTFRVFLVIMMIGFMVTAASADMWHDIAEFISELFDPGNSADSPTGGWTPIIIECTYTDIMNQEHNGHMTVCAVGYGSCLATICR